jgi:FkbM family methyltransferase
VSNHQTKSHDFELDHGIASPSGGTSKRQSFEILVTKAKRILQQASKIVGLNSAPSQGYRDLVIHTPLSTSAPPLMTSIISALRDQRETFLYHVKPGVFANRGEIPNDFQGDVRGAIYQFAAEDICKSGIERILVIPSCFLDIAVGIAAADVTGAPMALLLISDELLRDLGKIARLMTEALTKAHFVATADDEMASRLQFRFGEKVWRLPRFNSELNASARQQSINNTPQVLEWIWDALADCRPRDEASGATSDSGIVPYVDPPAPKELHWEMRPHFLALQRLKNLGCVPDFVVDVGASTGYWSHICQQIFSSSRFYLFEPLLSEYQRKEGAIYRLHPEFTAVEVAVSDRSGTITFNMAPDLYGSSFVADSGSSKEGAWKQLQVPAKTLAELALELGVGGRGLMKIDVQFAEHLVLEGAKGFLDQIDVIFVELSLGRLRPQAKTFAEMFNYLRGLGFEYFDVAGWWREPQTGQLVQQDAVFARRALSKLSY